MMFHVRHVPSRPKASLRHFNCAVRQYLSRHRTTSQNVTRSFLHSIAFLFRPNTLRSFSILTEPVGRSEKHLLPDGLSIKRKDRTLCGTDNDNIPPRWRWSSASFYCSWLHCCCATLWFLWMAMVIIMVIMVMVNIFLSRVSLLTRDIDIANLSVRLSVLYVPVSDENGLTYRHSFFSPYGSPIILVLSASNIFTKLRRGHPLSGR